MTDQAKPDPLGILPDNTIPPKSQVHFDVGDGWEIILTGEELRRPKTLTRVAITRAEITFDSEANLLTFLELIKESDARLSKVPDSEVMYDWQMLRRKDLTVRFGVTWYDEHFYQQRKDAHHSSMHGNIFSKFGASADAMRIEHIPL